MTRKGGDNTHVQRNELKKIGWLSILTLLVDIGIIFASLYYLYQTKNCECSKNEGFEEAKNMIISVEVALIFLLLFTFFFCYLYAGDGISLWMCAIILIFLITIAYIPLFINIDRLKELLTCDCNSKVLLGLLYTQYWVLTFFYIVVFHKCFIMSIPYMIELNMLSEEFVSGYFYWMLKVTSFAGSLGKTLAGINDKNFKEEHFNKIMIFVKLRQLLDKIQDEEIKKRYKIAMSSKDKDFRYRWAKQNVYKLSKTL